MLYFKDYASHIKDCLVTELTDLSRNMMLSIDIVPVPTDEAVREVETRLLGVETEHHQLASAGKTPTITFPP